MSLLDIYRGEDTWAEYLKSHETLVPAVRGETVTLELSGNELELAQEAGFGAIGVRSPDTHDAPVQNLELSAGRIAGGLESLKADFNLLMGDLMWKVELGEETLGRVLQEIRLAEFEREARAYRTRAERAYLNGWYEEALADFLEAEKRNYPDYTVHRSIACLYFYHFIDLPKALEYFRKAAKYARPSDARQCAEALYFAGVVCALEQKLTDAQGYLAEAVQVNPELHEAHYQRASLAALEGDSHAALESLEAAIKGDSRYYERAQCDPAFEGLGSQVRALLDRLIQPVQERVDEVRRDAEALRGYVIAPPEKARIERIFHEVEDQMSTGLTYRTGLGVLEKLSEAETELRGIRQRFQKHYEIYPRDYIRSVAFSHDGQWLACGFLSGGLQVCEVDSGLQLYSVLGHFASVNAVAFSPDNLWLVSASRDRKIKLWEAQTGSNLQTLSGHTGEVRAVAFSPDGQWLASGSHDRSIRLWRVATGHESQALFGHTMQVTATLFSPDGNVIASGSWDRTIKLWDVATGRVIRTLTGHYGGVASLAFSPDGSILASGSEDGEIRLWEIRSGRAVQKLAGHRNGIASLAFSPDGGLLASGSLGQTIILWRVATGTIVRVVHYENISYNSVAFSPQGQWLALGSRDLQLWLKVLLTQAEYSAVQAGKARAQEARLRAEQLTPYTSIHVA